jgi:hypothetical protein
MLPEHLQMLVDSTVDLSPEEKEPSQSPWSAPTVLIMKKDGSTRLCMVFRTLNKNTKKDTPIAPYIDYFLDTLKMVLFVRLASGYWQMGLPPVPWDKMFFATHSALYQVTNAGGFV